MQLTLSSHFCLFTSITGFSNDSEVHCSTTNIKGYIIHKNPFF